MSPTVNEASGGGAGGKDVKQKIEDPHEIIEVGRLASTARIWRVPVVVDDDGDMVDKADLLSPDTWPSMNVSHAINEHPDVWHSRMCDALSSQGCRVNHHLFVQFLAGARRFFGLVAPVEHAAVFFTLLQLANVDLPPKGFVGTRFHCRMELGERPKLATDFYAKHVSAFAPLTITMYAARFRADFVRGQLDSLDGICYIGSDGSYAS